MSIGAIEQALRNPERCSQAKLACQHCQQLFVPNKNRRKYCSHRCSAISLSIANGNHPWREPELLLLEKLSGRYPFPDIVQRVQSLDRRRGWSVRTEAAISSQMKRMRLSFRCTLDNFTCIELASVLNIGVGRVRYTWKRRHGLPVRRIAKNQNAISLKEFRVWATAHPSCLAGIDRDCLLWVLGDPVLAEHCSQLPVVGQGKPKKVRRLDTGEEYPTLKAAAAAVHVEPATISEALRTKRACVGIWWEVVQA